MQPKRQRKPYHKDFRFKKTRGYWYVIYRIDPGHTRSTGIPVDLSKKDLGEMEAVAWAYANMSIKRDSSITLGRFAKDFFTDNCAWVQRMRKKGYTWHPLHLPQHRGRLINYILPRFRSVPIHMIRTKQIDEWLMDLDSARSGAPLSPGSLDKILVGMKIILREAEYQGVINWHGKNPAEKIEPFDRRESRGRRQPFTLEEIRKLFPGDFAAAVEIWQTSEWYAYFLMQWVTGMRPSEVAGFMLQDWIKEYHGAVIERAIEHRTLRIKGLKTEKRGVTVKAVFFSEQFEEILFKLEENGAPRDDLLFRSINGKPIILESAAKHFRICVPRAGVELRGRTPYCLKHSFYTEALKHMTESDVAKLAGHRYLRKEYDHRKAIDFLKQRQGLKRLVDRINAA